MCRGRGSMRPSTSSCHLLNGGVWQTRQLLGKWGSSLHHLATRRVWRYLRLGGLFRPEFPWLLSLSYPPLRSEEKTYFPGIPDLQVTAAFRNNIFRRTRNAKIRQVSKLYYANISRMHTRMSDDVNMSFAYVQIGLPSTCIVWSLRIHSRHHVASVVICLLTTSPPFLTQSIKLPE